MKRSFNHSSASRTRPATSLFLTVSALFIVMQGCNTTTDLQQPQNPPDEPTGGTAAVTPGLSTGGTSSVATTTPGATGGTGTATTTATGGTATGNPQGGAGTGGKATTAATGGKPATGGAGVNPTGGAGVNPTGGAPAATGGAGVVTETGGAPVVGAGGTTTTTTVVNSGKTVTFNSSGKALGAMTGWAYVSLGTADTLTDPTCGTAKTVPVPGSGCATSANWSTAGVCMTGSIPALPASPTGTDYSSNWGVSIGVNASATDGGGLGQSFTSIAITVTGSPLTGLRAIVHRSGDAVDKSYCAPMTSGTAIPLTSFQTDCYSGTSAVGAKILAADIPNIDKVTVQVSSGATAITVTNLCMTGITFS